METALYPGSVLKSAAIHQEASKLKDLAFHSLY